jgi:ornithine--oxo-acid transaminase
MHEYFGYDKVLPMNTGVEAVETAIKLAIAAGDMPRRGFLTMRPRSYFVEGNFHGRTIAAISASTDSVQLLRFRPSCTGFCYRTLR